MRAAALASLMTLATVLVRHANLGPVWVFCLAGLTLMLWGDVMARATEEVSVHLGGVAGGVLNATFGNSTELAVGLLALSQGHVDVVKGTLVGSILTNLLLILGLAGLVGGIRYKTQGFEPRVAGTMISTLTVAVIAFLTPTVLPNLGRSHERDSTLIQTDFSLGVSALLIGLYLMGLVFSLVTHRDFFSRSYGEAGRVKGWSLPRGIGVMLATTAVIVVMSDALVDSLEGMMRTLPLTPGFLGVIVLAAFSNAADLSVATRLARRNRLDLVFQLVSGAATQVALFVGPLFILVGQAMGVNITLQFSMLNVLSITVSALIIAVSCSDGEFDWYKGLQLLGVYGILAVAQFCY